MKYKKTWLVSAFNSVLVICCREYRQLLWTMRWWRLSCLWIMFLNIENVVRELISFQTCRANMNNKQTRKSIWIKKKNPNPENNLSHFGYISENRKSNKRRQSRGMDKKAQFCVNFEFSVVCGDLRQEFFLPLLVQHFNTVVELWSRVRQKSLSKMYRNFIKRLQGWPVFNFLFFTFFFSLVGCDERKFCRSIFPIMRWNFMWNEITVIVTVKKCKLSMCELFFDNL